MSTCSSSQIRGSTVLIELLTEVELLMLAKRLAVILMLIDEQSYYRIKQVLGTSVSTSKRIHKFLIGGAYTQVENWCMNKKQRQELLQSIEMLMRAGLPPKAYVIKKRR